MSLAAPAIFLIASAGAFICCAKALWHAFGMVRGIRASSEWWVNLVPFMAFAFRGSLDPLGQTHRMKFVSWAYLAMAFAAIAGIVLFVFYP